MVWLTYMKISLASADSEDCFNELQTNITLQLGDTYRFCGQFSGSPRASFPFNDFVPERRAVLAMPFRPFVALYLTRLVLSRPFFAVFRPTLLHTVSHAMHEDLIYKVELNPIANSEADEK